MTAHTGNDEQNQEREEVRAAFRAAAFDDEPPAELDAAILAAANDARRRRLHGFLPPFAMAATVVLALGLVLRLAIPTREPPAVSAGPEAELEPSTLESGAMPGETASGSADASRERATLQATSPAADSSAAAAPAPAATREEIVVNARTPAAAADASAATQAMSAAPDDCAAQFGQNPEGWLSCVAMLLEAGDEAAARRELAAFTARFPDSAVPDSIATRLER